MKAYLVAYITPTRIVTLVTRWVPFQEGAVPCGTAQHNGNACTLATLSFADMPTRDMSMEALKCLAGPTGPFAWARPVMDPTLLEP